jgi:hypothetical protein
MRTTPSRFALPLLLLAGVVALASLASTGSVDAQRRRRPRNIPMAGTPVVWTLFVSPHGTTPAQRGPVGAEAGLVTIPETPYQCRYSAPNRAAISAENWSETRSLECQFGTTIVSTSGFCQVAGPSWGPRAAVLYLSEAGGADRVEVSIDCAVQPPTP